MIGYKAFIENNRKYHTMCGDTSLEYEIGKEYSIEGELKMCNNGYHFCYDPIDTLIYYTLENTIVFKITVEGSTVITDGKEFFINPTGRENLATVGSGDVLAGIIGSLYAQTKNALNSAISGVYLHGLCGDMLYKETGSSSTLASELIGKISKAKSETIS